MAAWGARCYMGLCSSTWPSDSWTTGDFNEDIKTSPYVTSSVSVIPHYPRTVAWLIILTVVGNLILTQGQVAKMIVQVNYKQNMAPGSRATSWPSAHWVLPHSSLGRPPSSNSPSALPFSQSTGSRRANSRHISTSHSPIYSVNTFVDQWSGNKLLSLSLSSVFSSQLLHHLLVWGLVIWQCRTPCTWYNRLGKMVI